jgi:lipid II:glycine glycyltransferase (peptidoglycan interpeptide bridge formation enzyme)
MPIVLQRRYGFTIIRQPPLTPTLGPWVDLASTKLTTRIAEQKALFNSLIDQLPRWDYFQANFNHRITNWLPFYWRGFKQTTRYTYILDDLSNTETVWKGLRAEVRTQIRKAERRLSVRTDLSIDDLLDVVELTFRRQGKQLPFTRELVRRIDEACLGRAARQMFFAMDADKRIHAVLYLVRDAEYAYYLLGGADPRLRSSGGQLLLFWEAIKIAASLNLKFDFEGSMIEPIERVFRAFGAVQVPYMQVYGARPLVQMLLLMRELLSA